MKKCIMLVGFLCLAGQVSGSLVFPPRIIVRRLIRAVQEQDDKVTGWYFTFDEKKHADLTPLSRAEQLALLKDLAPDKLKFERDQNTLDNGKRFVVRLVAPRKLDFEIQYKALKGDLGPPWTYEVIAIRRTAQQVESTVPSKAAPSAASAVR